MDILAVLADKEMGAGSTDKGGPWTWLSFNPPSTSYTVSKSCAVYHSVSDPNPDPHWFSSAESGSGSRRAKMPSKIEKREEISKLLSARWSLLRVEGFSCSLEVLYGDLRICKLQVLIKKYYFFFSCEFFSFFGHQTLDLDPDPHWLKSWIQCGSETLVYRQNLKIHRGKTHPDIACPQ